MANYLLVHGGNVSATTWNKLVASEIYPVDSHLGGEVWCLVAARLEQLGHTVIAPTLTNEYQNNLSSHIDQIARLIDDYHLTDVILVGHSYGGMVITAVGCQFSDKISHLVYLDAALPDVGQSLFDLLRQANIDPAQIIEGSPQAYTEKIIFDPNSWQGLSKHYLRCSQSEFMPATALAKAKIMADSQHWHYSELATGHLPMATLPDDVVHYLLDLG